MPLYGFRDRKTAETLAQVARERQSTPQNSGKIGVAYDTVDGGTTQLPGRKLPALRGYLAVPSGEIPGARKIYAMDDDGVMRWKLVLGVGTACIHRRDQANSPLTKVQRERETNAVVTRTVYNFCPDPIQPADSDCANIGPCPDTVMFVTQDMWGDLYVVEWCEQEQTSSSSSDSSQPSVMSSSSGSSESSQDSSSDSGSSESSKSSSDSGSSESSSSGSSESESSLSTDDGSSSISVSDSDTPPSSEDDCNYTGSITVVTGLTGGPCEFTATRKTMTFENGKLCSITSASSQPISTDCCCSSDSEADPSEDPSGSEGDPSGSEGDSQGSADDSNGSVASQGSGSQGLGSLWAK